MEYPELDKVADEVSDMACVMINRLTRDIKSEMPYKGQYILERVIKILQERV